MTNFIDMDILLKPGIVASVEVGFSIESSGISVDGLDPPELDMFEIRGLNIYNIMCFSSFSFTADGVHPNVVWYKTLADLIQSGWHDDWCKLANKVRAHARKHWLPRKAA